METQEAPTDAGQATEAPADTGQATQTEAPLWFDGAPDEIKGYIQNKGWDDPIKAVTSYQELEKFRGANEKELIKIPKEGESWDEVYTRLGRPETPEGYNFEFPEGMQVDEGRLGAFTAKAHELGLNQKQAMELIIADSEFSQAALVEMQEQMVQKSEAELAQLEKDWGKDAFAERAEMSRRLIRSSLPEGMDADSTLTAIEDAIGSANMIKFFSNIAEKSGGREDRIPEGDGDRPFGYTKEQAVADKAALASEIQADPKRLENYNKGIGPDYQKMQKLLKRLAG